MTTTFIGGAAIIIGAAACVTDLHSRRIPNWLTFGAAAAAFAAHYAYGGPEAARQATSGWVTGLFMFMPLFLLGGMGAGDVKLLAALGAWLGPAGAFWLAIYSSMAGGVMAVIVALRHNYLGTAFKNLGALSKFWWHVGPRQMEALTLERATAPKLAYAVPMFLGVLVTLWFY
jgi:prepilin peptidase CpaA